MKKVFIFAFLLCLSQAVSAQRPMETIIDDAYGYIDGHNYGKEDIKWARLNFRLVKWFSFKKSIYNDARQGLAVCKFAGKDTVAGIRRLKRIIGYADYSKIEKGDFDDIKESKKEQWPEYFATRKLIDIYIARKDYTKAKAYLTYLHDYVHVVWYCGDGSMAHTNYVKSVRDKIAAANP